MYVGLDVPVVTLHSAFNSCYCSAVTNFVVQAAVPKTAKVNPHDALYPSVQPSEAVRFRLGVLASLSNHTLQVALSPATGTSLSPSGGNIITQVNFFFTTAPSRLQLGCISPLLISSQVMRVSNTIVDQKPLAMRLKISYTTAAGPISKTHDVTNFPPGV
jgi:hypothetical protein